MTSQTPYEALETAMSVLGFQWAVRGDEFVLSDEIDAVEALQAEAAAFPQDHLPLADLYPRVARIAALSVSVLASLGDPDEIDGLQGFEGFGLWRESG